MIDEWGIVYRENGYGGNGWRERNIGGRNFLEGDSKI